MILLILFVVVIAFIVNFFIKLRVFLKIPKENEQQRKKARGTLLRSGLIPAVLAACLLAEMIYFYIGIIYYM